MSHHTRRQFTIGLAGAAVLGSVASCSDSEHHVVPDPRFAQGPFDASATAEQVTAGVDLTGRTALVTGCTSGLGYETLRVLALRGAHVIGTGRTLEKAAAACNSVTGSTTPMALELSDFDSVVSCAQQIGALSRPLDMTICNAGINTFGELELSNGVERMFAVNFLGHFLLINRLSGVIKATENARIVHVGSRSGYRSAPPEGIDFGNLRGEHSFDAQLAYGRSKLANALFSLELARRLKGSSVTSNVVHPGLVQTNIARTAPGLIKAGFEMLGGVFAKSPAEGAATQVYVATSTELDGVSGAYFEDCNAVIIEGPNSMFDADMARRLWTEAESMTAPYLADVS